MKKAKEGFKLITPKKIKTDRLLFEDGLLFGLVDLDELNVVERKFWESLYKILNVILIYLVIEIYLISYFFFIYYKAISLITEGLSKIKKRWQRD